MNQLKIEHSTRNTEGGVNNAVVTVVGRIEQSTDMKLQEALNPYQDGTFSAVVLDFERLEYINSTGLGILIKLADRLTERGSRLALAGVPDRIQTVLKMMQLDRFLRCFANVDEALAADGID